MTEPPPLSIDDLIREQKRINDQTRRDRLVAEIEAEARKIASKYVFEKPSPGVTVPFLNMPPEVHLPEGLCWEEFDRPPASEVANGYLYDKQIYIYGYNDPRWRDHSPYEPGEWPATLMPGTEYFIVLLYKDAAK
jgi:hypothetical protein